MGADRVGLNSRRVKVRLQLLPLFSVISADAGDRKPVTGRLLSALVKTGAGNFSRTESRQILLLFTFRLPS